MSTESAYTVSTTNVEQLNGSAVATVGMSVRSIESFFLPTEELKGYEDTLPGSAERLFSIMEKQAYHRMELEKISLNKHFEGRNRHFALGFIALVLFAGLSVFFAVWGMEWAAVTAIGCPALYGLSNFISSKKRQVDLPT